MESDNLLVPGAMNILNRRRKATDVLVLINFGVFLLLWIAIAAYVFSTAKTIQLLPPDILRKIVETITLSRIFIVIGYILFAGVCTVTFTGVLLRLSKFSYLTLAVFWLPFVAWIMFTALFYCNIFTIYGILVAFCSAVLTCVLIHTEWFHLTEAIIKESCKVIRFFPMAILFSLVWYPLCLILVLIFGVMVHLQLEAITLDENATISSYVAFFSTVNVLGSTWLLVFVFNFGQMILGGAFATWFWAANKEVVPSDTVLRCIKFTIRYHLGTLAYDASIFGIFQALLSTIRYLRERLRDGVNATIFFLIAYNILDAIVVRFAIYNAVISCALYGKGFYNSVENTMGYFSRHPRRCLMMSKMTECILLLAILFVSLLMLLVVQPYFITSNFSSDEMAILSASIACGSLLFVLPLIGLLVAAFNAMLLCCLEDSERNNGSEDRPYLASPELRAAMQT